MVNRRKFIGTLASVGATAALPHEARAQQKELKQLEVSKPNGLNLIIIISDTFRWDYLHFNGVNERIQTPNLDALASESVYFSNCYADSLPSIPARRVIHTGKSIITKNPKWAPLFPDDVTIAQILNKTGSFTEGIISDFVFYFAPTEVHQPTFSFNQGFNGFYWIRGNVHDSYITGPRSSITDAERHLPEHYMTDSLRERLFQYLLDNKDNTSEDDYCCARVCRTAGKWLEDNKDNDGPFMLFVDMFDPHEPWDAPPEYIKKYRKDFSGARYLIDYDAKLDAITEEDTAILTDHYAAEVTFVDHCVGRLISDVKRLGLRDTTIIVFTSDHGTHLGEMGCVMKQSKLCNSAVTRVPLIIRHPDNSFSGKRIDALTGHVDFTPTFLSLLGVETNMSFDGKNMWDLVTGSKTKLRDYIVTNYGSYGSVHTHKWHYFQHVRNDNEGFGPQLYDVVNDHAEEKNVVKDYPEAATGLKQILKNVHEVR